ncbi:MAG: FAD-dependent oxidoreductase [Steroidobacteraceae bacterium]
MRVVDEADVLVVGGGPAGIGAALAAARSGARTILVERYGHLGGMATGGLVILLPHLSDGSTHQDIMGISQEWIDRLDRVGGAIHPDRAEIGSSSAASIERWRHYFSCVVNDHIRQSVYVDPELLKCVLNDMIEEAGVRLYLHSWGCRAVTEGGTVRGVVFESKEGRQAILGKVTIDGTGDGDVMATAGAAFEGGYDVEDRSAMLAVVFRLGNVDFRAFSAWRDAHAEEWKAVQERIFALGNFRLAPFPTPRNDVMWVNNWVPGRSCLDVGDLTWTELNVRKAMRGTQAILGKDVPGFRDCFILDTASQLGTRGSRRLAGEHRLTLKEVSEAQAFDDVIALLPSLRPSGRNRIQVPYRSLVPREVEGLLVAGRCFSSDAPANNLTNLIPHCIATGQAAGTAAALALDAGVRLRDVQVARLQQELRRQGVPLP